MSAASVPGRCRVYRDERFPTGACDANRSQTARSASQEAGAKGWEANARPKEHKWAVRQDVRGQCASNHKAQESLMASCRAQRRERKDQALTRGGPCAERRGEVSRGHSSDRGTDEQKDVPSEGPKNERAELNENLKRLRESSETAGPDNCGRHPGPANQGPSGEAAPSRGSGRQEVI